MARLVGILDGLRAVKCIHFADGYKYQLRAPYVTRLEIRPEHGAGTDWLTLETDGTLTIRAGYAWDGASGPTFDSKSSMRASLVHDALYQLMRLGLLNISFRPAVDAIFRRMCKEDGMWSPRAQLWYLAVRIFASPAADPASESPDKHAPTDVCMETP
jgi:hypothetical protein